MLWWTPRMPSQLTLPMMAKAATAVYETAAEKHDRDQQGRHKPKRVVGSFPDGRHGQRERTPRFDSQHGTI